MKSRFLSLPLLGLLLAPLFGHALAAAEVRLPAIFSDNMVLQRDAAVPIWGWAGPGDKVTVEFAGQRKQAKADKTGRWETRLSRLTTSDTPADLIVTGANRLVLTNVLVGEVWFCSGQSNMEKPIGKQSGQKPVPNFEAELRTGDAHPTIRLFKVEKALRAAPTDDVRGAWRVCSSNALEATKFSAVAYFFARAVQVEIHVPIGLIESSWGGTRIEPWTPPAGFAAAPKLKGVVSLPSANDRVVVTTPTALFNGMVAPVVPFAIRGALWYQGESNCMDKPDGRIYADKMAALIKGWRKVWGEGDFPFYYVQLAPYCYFTDRPNPRVPSAESLPEIWEAQTLTLRLPKTGMTVITDLVDDLKDIHPTRKVKVGERLARLALANDYGRKDIETSGPMFKSLKVRDGKAILSFTHVDGGLVSKDGQPLTWFTMADEDGNFLRADATIEGDTVVLFNYGVPEPKAVRFGWNETAQPNLFNRAGLPAGPFRTDKPR